MDLRHLRHFVALAESGSFHRAARKLNLRQPALSQSIHTLEDDVGAHLVESSPSGTRLTQAGKAFLHEVRHILAALERAARIARHTATGTDTPLRLGITGDTVTSRLAAALHGFPQNDIIISDGITASHRTMLDNGLLDLALLPASAVAGYAHSESEVVGFVWTVFGSG